MKILILHFRSAPTPGGPGAAFTLNPSDSAGTDGVSLEMKKRRAILQEMGHEVQICSAYSWADMAIPALEFDRRETAALIRNLFGDSISDFQSAAELEAAFRTAKDSLKVELHNMVKVLSPEMMFVHNVLALPVHPAATVALTEVLAETGLPCVAIHHDILSEGAYKFRPTCDFARSLLQNYYPPKRDNLAHWTINTRNQKALAAKGITAGVIHDTMDFRHPLDAESHRRLRLELRAKYQIGASDVVLFVGARIAPNKQIEFAARLTAALEALRHKLAGKRLYSGEVFQLESRIVLVLAGRPERAFADYQAGLWSLMDDLGLNWVYAGDSVSPLRVPGQGYYALYPDMYSIADFVLYPSSWEGFGNQLLEAFAVGLPVVVFEYPVYKEDIAPKGVKVISLGDAVAKISETALSDAADQMIPLLTDTAAREQVTSHNREIGKRHFDFEVLRAHLAESIRWAAERGLQRPVSPQKRNR